jgi:hypothetical protein
MTPRLLTIIATVGVLCMAGLGAVLLAGNPGFSSADPEASAVAKRGSISAGDHVPAPTGKPILRFTGGSSGNAGPQATEIDFRTLERMPLVKVRIDEPFVKREMSFSGVRMSDLLAIVGVPRSAGRVYMHALDDYHVRLTQGQLASSGAILATRADGARIPVKEGGPIRVIFPNTSDVADNTDNWIWSVDRMKASR